MTNTLSLSELADNDFRKTLPRYQEQYQENNEQLAKAFAGVAAEKNCTPAQLALAWLLAQGDNIIPIPGTKKRSRLADNAGSADVQLSAQDMEDIEKVLAKYPDIGDRYNEASYRLVDKS
jgi:aryl-alcohol dehydrogenase-like predicted oxidoreductase